MKGKNGGGGYINASPIRVPIAGEMLHYIAAQGPLETTAQHWWQMVWEQGTQVIAMLTKLKVRTCDPSLGESPHLRKVRTILQYVSFLKIESMNGGNDSIQVIQCSCERTARHSLGKS